MVAKARDSAWRPPARFAFGSCSVGVKWRKAGTTLTPNLAARRCCADWNGVPMVVDRTMDLADLGRWSFHALRRAAS